jgi:NAD(P)-dependent dehydrogenase (short-subunit alcohol dehydrogenase family)
MASIVDIAREYWQAEASRDLDRIMSFFTDDADWAGATMRLKGKTPIREFYAESAARFPGLEVEVGRAFGGPDEAAIEWHAVFTDPGGRRYPLSGVNLMSSRDGLISSLTHYDDPTPLSRAPAPAVQVARQDRFAGRHVLVTGGGGGIGAATARQFLAEGATVTAVDTSEDGLAYQRRSLEQLAARYQSIVGDITDAGTQKAIVETAADSEGVLHVLVNNAAVFLLGGVEATEHQWRRTLEVNLMGPAQLTAVAAEALGKSGKGAVVNVASISAHRSGPNRWTYNASKGGVFALTKCQALDLAPLGIRANSVSPGYTWTEVLDRSAGGDRVKWDPIWGAACPMRRCCDPHEVASVIAFLASDEASYVNGSDLTVDGGLVSMAPDGLVAYEFSS